MMNRSSVGLSAFAGRGRPMSSAPRRQGIADLAHAAGGETVLPNAAMRRDPMLRQMAMRSLSRQGRDPSRFTMGGRNSRNPGTGRPEFADYIPGVGWVDSPVTDTSSPFDTHAGSGQPDVDAAYRDYWDQRAALGQVASNDPRVMAETAPYDPGPSTPNVDAVYDQYWGQRANLGQVQAGDPRAAGTGVPSYTSTSDGSGANSAANLIDRAITDGAPQFPASPPVTPPSLDQWSAIDTYDEWRQSRNPAGKGFQDMPYGAAVGAGASASLTSPFQNPQGVMGAQMPAVQQMPWSTPGTSGLGMARDSGSETPSILNSGYAPAGGPYGASQGWMNPFGQQGGGIQSQQGLGAFAGGQQNKQTPNYQQAFRY